MEESFEEDETTIVRRKRFQILPMDEEEAEYTCSMLAGAEVPMPI